MKFFRLLSILAFLGLVFLVYTRVKAYQSSPSEDSSGIFVLILLFILTAVIGALLFVPSILSAFGEQVGEAMMSSGEKVGDDPYAKARSKIAAGDYKQAIDAYRTIAKEHPTDRMPIIEIVKLYQDKLHQPDNAVHALERALKQDQWEHDDKAVFMFKLADLHLEQTGDQQAAIDILTEVTTIFPHTRHAANATHKLREIDPALVPVAGATDVSTPPVKNPPAPDATAGETTETPKPSV